MNWKNLWAGYFVFSLIFSTHSSVNFKCVYQRLPFHLNLSVVESRSKMNVLFSDESVVLRYINLNFLSGKETTTISMQYIHWRVIQYVYCCCRISYIYRAHSHKHESKTNVKMDTKKPPFTCYTFESEGKLTVSKNRISNEWKTKWNFQFSVAIQNKCDSQYFLLYFLLLFIHIHMTIVLNDWVREKVVVSASIVFAYNSFISYDINRIECCQGVTRYLFKYYTIEKKKKKKNNDRYVQR